MLPILLSKKAQALLHRFNGRIYVDLTDKFTCWEFRDGLDLSKAEFEKIVQVLNDSGYADIKQQGPVVILTVTDQGKAVVAGRDPFKVREKGAAK